MLYSSDNPGTCLVCARITWNVSKEKMAHICSEKCEKEVNKK